MKWKDMSQEERIKDIEKVGLTKEQMGMIMNVVNHRLEPILDIIENISDIVFKNEEILNSIDEVIRGALMGGKGFQEGNK